MLQSQYLLLQNHFFAAKKTTFVWSSSAIFARILISPIFLFILSFRAMFLIDSEGVVVARQVSPCMDVLIILAIYLMLSCTDVLIILAISLMITFFIPIPVTSIHCIQFGLIGRWGTCPQVWVPGKQRDWSCAMQVILFPFFEVSFSNPLFAQLRQDCRGVCEPGDGWA